MKSSVKTSLSQCLLRQRQRLLLIEPSAVIRLEVLRDKKWGVTLKQGATYYHLSSPSPLLTLALIWWPPHGTMPALATGL